MVCLTIMPAVVRVSCDRCAHHAFPSIPAGYQSLVGATDTSWGWDLGRNKVYHDAKNNEGVTYPSVLNDADLNSTFIVPDKFKGQSPISPSDKPRNNEQRNNCSPPGVAALSNLR